MEFRLVPCSECQGRRGYALYCGGCGRWVLVACHDGKRYAGPYDGQRFGWTHMPTLAEVAAEERNMVAMLAPSAIAQAIGEAIEAVTG